MVKAKKARQHIAKLVVWDLPTMNDNQRLILLSWLRGLTKIVRKPKQYASPWTATLMKPGGNHQVP